MVTGLMLKEIEGFHHRASHRISGMTACRLEDGEWEYPLVDDVIGSMGLWRIRNYIRRRQTTIAAQVAYRPIYELCTGA